MNIAQVGEEILRKPAVAVTDDDIASQELQEFVQQLLATMTDANGIGIAAPQVFDPRAIMIIASKANPRYPDAPDMQPQVLINPTIIQRSEQTCWEWEGQYLSANGQPKTVRYEGFIARIFLHEYDHLIGKTWLDHITDSRNIMANDVWNKKFVI